MSTLPDTVEMFAELVLATIATRMLTPRRALTSTSRLCDVLMSPVSHRPPDELARAAHHLVTHLSPWVIRSNCLDEAIASRIWLARRGVSGDVVVGMRRSANQRWDGHAWLVVEDLPYGLGDLNHTVVFRESELSP